MYNHRVYTVHKSGKWICWPLNEARKFRADYGERVIVDLTTVRFEAKLTSGTEIYIPSWVRKAEAITAGKKILAKIYPVKCAWLD